MRRRENISLSSTDRVERKGTHVGRMALLLTLLFLNGRCMLTKMPPSPQVHRSRDTAPIYSPGIVTLNRNHSCIGPYDDQVARRSRFVGQTCFVDQGVWGHLERTFGRVNKSVKQTSQLEPQHRQIAQSVLGRTHRSISCKGTGCPPHSQSSAYRMP